MAFTYRKDAMSIRHWDIQADASADSILDLWSFSTDQGERPIRIESSIHGPASVTIRFSVDGAARLKRALELAIAYANAGEGGEV